MTLACQNEESILKKIIERSGALPGNRRVSNLSLGIGDDAALFRATAGHETVLTCDWFLEGTHFLRDKYPPDAIGWKSLARAVSDIAAMGGTPRCFLLSLALPETHTGRWLDQFLGGLRRAARKFHCVLAGGDTTRRKEILVNVMVVGEVPADRAVLRSGARAGDIIYVSGSLGEADFGLRLLKRSKGFGKPSNPWLRKHLYPEPRLALGQWLAKDRLATALMDLSDGLSSDLPRLCAASGVGARVESVKIPLVQIPAGERKSGVSPLQLALHGGDDYELLFSVPRQSVSRFPRAFRGVPITAIGEIIRGQKLLLIRGYGHEQSLVSGGWDPFRRKS